MRYGGLWIALVACGSEPKPEPVPPRPASGTFARIQQPTALDGGMAPVEPELALTLAQNLIVVEVTGTTASCETWTIEPSVGRMYSQKTIGGATVVDDIKYELAGDKLQIEGVLRDFQNGTTIGRPCATTLDVKESEHGPIVGGATWFTDRDRCLLAIKTPSRVATNFGCALPPIPAVANDQAKTRKRFEGILRKGGTLFSIVDGASAKTCKPVRVRAKGRGLAGTIEWDVFDGNRKGVTSYGYDMQPGDSTLELTGPGTQWTGGDVIGVGCLDSAKLDFQADAVHLREPLYFTERECRAAANVLDARMKWFARPPAKREEPTLGRC